MSTLTSPYLHGLSDHSPSFLPSFIRPSPHLQRVFVVFCFHPKNFGPNFKNDSKTKKDERRQREHPHDSEPQSIAFKPPTKRCFIQKNLDSHSLLLILLLHTTPLPHIQAHTDRPPGCHLPLGQQHRCLHDALPLSISASPLASVSSVLLPSLLPSLVLPPSLILPSLTRASMISISPALLSLVLPWPQKRLHPLAFLVLATKTSALSDLASLQNRLPSPARPWPRYDLSSLAKLWSQDRLTRLVWLLLGTKNRVPPLAFPWSRNCLHLLARSWP